MGAISPETQSNAESTLVILKRRVSVSGHEDTYFKTLVDKLGRRAFDMDTSDAFV